MTPVDYAGLGVGAFVMLVVLFVLLSVLVTWWEDRQLAKHIDKAPGTVRVRAGGTYFDPREGYALDDPKLRAFDGRWS